MTQHEFDLLDNWLEIATRGLCDDAKARVHAEVEAHFAAAYEALVAAGHSVESAERGALQSLGSAGTAHTRFGKLYLTTTDADILRDLLRPRSVARKVCAASYLFVGVLLVFVRVVGVVPDGDAAQLIGFVAILLIGASSFALPTLLGRRLPRLVVAAQMLLFPLVGVCLFTGAFGILIGKLNWMMVAVAIAFAALVALPLWAVNARIIAKLGHTHNREASGL